MKNESKGQARKGISGNGVRRLPGALRPQNRRPPLISDGPLFSTDRDLGAHQSQTTHSCTELDEERRQTTTSHGPQTEANHRISSTSTARQTGGSILRARAKDVRPTDAPHSTKVSVGTVWAPIQVYTFYSYLGVPYPLKTPSPGPGIDP